MGGHLMKAAQPYTPLSEIPADLVSVTDYARRAPEHMPHAIYEYIAGGGADGEGGAEGKGGEGLGDVGGDGMLGRGGGGGAAAMVSV